MHLLRDCDHTTINSPVKTKIIQRRGQVQWHVFVSVMETSLQYIEFLHQLAHCFSFCSMRTEFLQIGIVVQFLVVSFTDQFFEPFLESKINVYGSALVAYEPSAAEILMYGVEVKETSDEHTRRNAYFLQQ